MTAHPADWIGWSAAAILLATISRQVYAQWRDCSFQGVSRWLFVGQIAASTGFVVYSWLLGNWVFVVTNALMLGVAATGQIMRYGFARRQRPAEQPKPHRITR
ncbi:MAG TPA: hypothetical protein VND87_00380 [Stellaceae bacterium]|nr:hypothetical protein [Stellaceae bacterium]